MAKKPGLKKAKVQEPAAGFNLKSGKSIKILKSAIENGEELLYGFTGIRRPNIGTYFLLGPMASFGARTYYVGITDKAVYFYMMNLIGIVEQADRFEYDEITSLDCRQGLLTYTMEFVFFNKRELRISVSRVKRLNYQPAVDYLEEKFA